MSSEAHAADHSREFGAGEVAFRKGEHPPDGASVSFLAGWQSQALQAGADLAKVEPLALALPKVRTALERAQFALRNYASAKLLPKAEADLKATRNAVDEALRDLGPLDEPRILSAPPATPPPAAKPTVPPAAAKPAKRATRQRRPARAGKART